MTIARWLPRFQQAACAIQVLADREQGSRAQIEAFQLQRLNNLWQHAVAHVPYYQQLARDHILPEKFSTLAEFAQRVPLLFKSSIKQDPKAFLSNLARRGSWKYTGGSTGTPISAYWSHEAHRESLSAKYRFQAQWGVEIFDRTAFLWAHGSSVAPGWRGRWSRFRQPYLDRLRNRLRLSAYDMRPETLNNYLARIRALNPVMIYGYSRALYLLAMEAQRSGGWRCPSLKVIVATSEPAWPQMIQTIEAGLGAPVAREYGGAECGIMACDGPDRLLRVREDHVILETLPRGDGQYDIVVTVLTNPSFPLVRYAIGDVTSAELAVPQCGFAVLADVTGRDNDLLLTKSGHYLHGIHVGRAFSDAAARILRRFSVRQARDGSVRIDVELHDPASAKDPAAAATLEAIRSFFDTRLGGYPVTLRIVPTIEQTAGGKHRVCQSDLYDLNTGRNQLRGSFRTHGAAYEKTDVPASSTP